MEGFAFDFEEWTKNVHLTSRTVQILTAEELTILPALLLLEDSDLRELSIALGQRKLLLDGIKTLKSNLTAGAKKDRIAEKFTPTPLFAHQKTKSAIFSSFNRKSLSFTTETYRSYKEIEKSKCVKYTCSKINIQEGKAKTVPRTFSTIMLVQPKDNGNGPFAASLSANGSKGDIFEFRDSMEPSEYQQATKEIDYKDEYTFRALEKYFSCCEIDIDNCSFDGLCRKDSKGKLLDIQKLQALSDDISTSL